MGIAQLILSICMYCHNSYFPEALSVAMREEGYQLRIINNFTENHIVTLSMSIREIYIYIYPHTSTK